MAERRLAILGGFCGALLAVLAFAAPGAARAGELRPLSTSGLCLSLAEDDPDSKPQGVPLVLAACTGGKEQNFRKGEGDALGVKERCVQVATNGPNARPGDGVLVGGCRGTLNERWGIAADGRLVGQNFLCVEVQGEGKAGDAVAMTECRKRPADVAKQRWAIYGKL